MVLEIAAYARKHLQIARQIFNDQTDNPFPKHTHRAFLLAQECEYFLELLQKHNFNVFEEDFRKNSVVKVPYAMY